MVWYSLIRKDSGHSPINCGYLPLLQQSSQTDSASSTQQHHITTSTMQLHIAQHIWPFQFQRAAMLVTYTECYWLHKLAVRAAVGNLWDKCSNNDVNYYAKHQPPAHHRIQYNHYILNGFNVTTC
eukprot:15364606-Ditylum_brightwellii.AAC.1